MLSSRLTVRRVGGRSLYGAAKDMFAERHLLSRGHATLSGDDLCLFHSMDGSEEFE